MTIAPNEEILAADLERVRGGAIQLTFNREAADAEHAAIVAHLIANQFTGIDPTLTGNIVIDGSRLILGTLLPVSRPGLPIGTVWNDFGRLSIAGGDAFGGLHALQDRQTLFCTISATQPAATLARTQAAETLAATGTVASNIPVAGALTRIQAAQTCAAAATVRVNGTLAVTETPDVLAGVAQVGIRATLAVTETPDTLVATGTTGGAFTGTVRNVGAGQTYATVADAMAAAADNDSIVVHADVVAQPVNITKNILLDLSATTWDFASISPSTFPGGGLGAIVASSTFWQINCGTIRNVALLESQAGLTSAIRCVNSGVGIISGGHITACQDGIGANNGIDLALTIQNIAVDFCGLDADPNHAHNIYIGHITRVMLNNVLSTNPKYAHAFKSRAHETHINGGIFESPHGACADIPSGGTCTINGAQLQKLSNTDDTKYINYAVEDQTEGLSNANTISRTTMLFQVPSCWIHTEGGTITFDNTNTWNEVNASFVSGAGIVIGYQ